MLSKLKSMFAARPVLLDEKAFAVRISKAIEAANPNTTSSIKSPLELLIKAPASAPLTENLRDIYDLYCQEPAKFEALKALRVAAICSRLTLSASPSIEVGRDHLLPLVRAEDPRELSIVIQRPLSPGLVSVLAFDSPSGVNDATTADLATLDLSDDHAYAIALENLEQRTSELAIEHLDHGLWVITGTTVPASSMLLAGDFWLTGPFADCRTLVAYAPDRNMLVVVDLDQEEAVSSAPTLAEELYQEAKDPLTLEPVIIKDGTSLEPECAPDHGDPVQAQTAPATLFTEDSASPQGPAPLQDPARDDGGATTHPATDLVDRIVAVIMGAQQAARDGAMSRQVTSNLVAALAFDLPGELKPMSMIDIDQLGANLDEVFELAVENIGLRFADMEVKEIEPGVHLVVCHEIAPGAALFCKPLWFDTAFAPYANLAAYLLPAHGLLVFDPTDRSTENIVHDVLEHFADETDGRQKPAFINVKHDGSLVDLASQYEPEPMPTHTPMRRFGRLAK